ncbi:MAG: pyridoxal-phosphate dependent enzyme [Candidatus Kapaibacteriales bacterium]
MKNNEKFIPNFKDIQNARASISEFIYTTPVLINETINQWTNAAIFFKCENLQKTGSFKIRGATNAILNYFDRAKKYGVVTHSSGNFAKALSFITRQLSIKATIIMPRSAPEIKINGVKANGATIIFCESTLESRQAALNDFLAHYDSVFIPPFDDSYIIAGQGTATIEFYEFLKPTIQLDYLIAPVGGGGLISGTAIASKFLSPKTKVIAAEPEGADDAFCSFRDRKLYPSSNPKTIADGLLTSLSELTFSIIRTYVDSVLTVKEENIVKAMELIFNEMKIVVEPSAAVALAVVLQYKNNFENANVGIILSGGNVDIKKLPFL